jgi:hypothetical protein
LGSPSTRAGAAEGASERTDNAVAVRRGSTCQCCCLRPKCHSQVTLLGNRVGGVDFAILAPKSKKVRTSLEDWVRRISGRSTFHAAGPPCEGRASLWRRAETLPDAR